MEYNCMAYDNIKKLIIKTTKKIIFLWTGLILFNIVFLFLYNNYQQKTFFINQQIIQFSEINQENFSILYQNSQKDQNITYQQSLLYQWLNIYRNQYEQIIPASKLELDLLSSLGENFYTPKQEKETNSKVQQFQLVDDQLTLLKRLSQNYLTKSPWVTLISIILFLNFGLLILAIILSLVSFEQLKKNIVARNEFILEDIWQELQGLEFHRSSFDALETKDPSILQNKARILMEDTRMLSLHLATVKEALIYLNEQINQNVQDMLQQQPTPKNNQNTPELEEKINQIQKLLSRLFTRSERSASLAKASANNGFQAGILALNISIEAARAGEAGRNFVPVSDRVKDFADKSSQIGNSLLDELKDVNLSIRKAHTIGKNILIMTDTFRQSPQQEDKKIQTEIQLNQDDFNELLLSFDQLLRLTNQIQSKTLEIEENIETEAPKELQSSPLQQIEFLRNTLIKSFERLYRLNYGIDPPTSDLYYQNPLSQERLP